MSRDLSAELKEAAPSPRSMITVDGLAARGRRRRRGRLAVTSAGCVVALVAIGAFAIGAGDDADSRLQVGASPPVQAPGEDTAAAEDPAEGNRIAPPLVEPNTGLVAGEAVSVTSDAFPEGTRVGVALCGTDELADGQGEAACDLTQVVMAEPSAEGATTTIHVDRAIHTPASGWVDCTAEAGRCAVAVGSLADQAGAWTEISFAADSAPTDTAVIEVLNVPAGPGGVVTIDDGTTVEVAGSGFPADTPIGVGLCPPKADCGLFLTTATTESDGTFTVDIPIKASLDVNGLDYECASGCRIVAARAAPPPPNTEPERAERIPVVVTST